ncbi:unnamed protein product [Dovyalis caffra]|uniref:Uncharacterized protein n=1 Tax=Dovyalis caffra TaxID=77055 RepID=A0AAV1RYE0_9ROSI|nr:unnamed protein product [Dovyalis caffra]
MVDRFENLHEMKVQISSFKILNVALAEDKSKNHVELHKNGRIDFDPMKNPSFSKA